MLDVGVRSLNVRYRTAREGIFYDVDSYLLNQAAIGNVCKFVVVVICWFYAFVP